MTFDEKERKIQSQMNGTGKSEDSTAILNVDDIKVGVTINKNMDVAGVPFDKSTIFKTLTPVSYDRRLELISEMKGEMVIEDILDNYLAKSHICTVGGNKSKILALKEGYYRAKCVNVFELSDKETLGMEFDPFNAAGQRHTSICHTISKRTERSEALGELLFALGGDDEERHSDSSLVIEDVDAFKKLVVGKSFGIEVSVNIETGWLYITDFFNLVGTDDFPTCPMEIVRNVF